MNALLFTCRIPESSPDLNADVASVGYQLNRPIVGHLFCRYRLARERLKRTGLVGRIRLYRLTGYPIMSMSMSMSRGTTIEALP